MPNEITAPILDISALQECANESAMKAARQEINDFYNGFNSPFRKAVREYLEKNTPSISFDLPNLVEEIQKSLISEIEKFESTTAIKNCVAAIRKSITKLNLENDGTIKLSSVLEEMEREIDTENGEYIEAEVGEPDPSYGWRDLEITIHKEDEEKNFKVTLHNDDKYENGKSAVIMTQNHDKFNSQYVSIVFVNEPDRNKGIATALLLHAIEMSPNGVSLHVNADNNIAYNLYRKLGFKPYGMQMPMREIFMATKKGLGGRENW